MRLSTILIAEAPLAAYTATRTVSVACTLTNLLRVCATESMWQPQGEHVHTHTHTRTKGRREILVHGRRAGEHITYNTHIRRVHGVEEEGKRGRREKREKYIGIRYRTEFRGGFRPTVQRGLSAGAGRRVRARGLAGAAGEGWPQRAGVARKGGR